MPSDPNKLLRRQAGTYRSADDRFEARQTGSGWFLVDTAQTDDLGQGLITGPYSTLAAVRETLPDARTTRKPQARPKRVAPPEPVPELVPEPVPKQVERLSAILTDAAHGRFPPADLAVEVLPAPSGKADAVIAFSGHNIVAADVDPTAVRRQLRDGDPGTPFRAPFLSWLSRRLGRGPGNVDVVLVAHPGWAPPKAIRLTAAQAPDEVARVGRAKAYRSEVETYADPDQHGLVILGRGLAGRLEVSIEVGAEHRGRGLGTGLARAALHLVPSDEPLFAQVAPGNVASLRAFLAAGYRPIGSEVLFLRVP